MPGHEVREGAPGAERSSGKGQAAGPPPLALLLGLRTSPVGRGWVGRGVCQRAPGKEITDARPAAPVCRKGVSGLSASC